MTFLLLGVGLLLLGGAGALVGGGSARWATRLGVGGAVAGSALGAIPALRVLAGGPPVSLRVPWDVPYGAFFVEIDALSAFFLLVIFIVSGVATIYGGESLLVAHGVGQGGDGTRGRLGSAWFFYNLLVAGMAMVVVARNGVLFLVAWEVMALASFFLVTLEDDDESVRDAGWTYLVATHLGTASLLALFVLLGREAGSLDFDRFAAVGPLAPSIAGVLFLLGVAGFGVKAGLVPFHVWLPEAHPAAPSHVSAVMSGAMIKVGIYGLVRLLTLLGPPPLWWGWVLVAFGLASAGLGVLFALAQHDLKRLLAYHSVENIGIIALGLGVGCLGLSSGDPALAVLGFGGGLLHVINHALFKSLLFLGAGAVLHGAGTREIDRLGGLLKRMPWTGVTFLCGAVAISGLPPLNGFVSEFLIYLGAFRAGAGSGAAAAVPGMLVIGGLALIGGLAAACFTKAFGIVFLGEPRSGSAANAREAPWPMTAPLVLLAAACVLIGVFAPAATRAMAPVLAQTTGLPAAVVGESLGSASGALATIAGASALFLALVGALALLRRRLLARREVATAGTWDCGYAEPTARMQYTSSSFADPITGLFRAFLRTRRRIEPPEGYFPARPASFSSETPDVFRESLYRPVFQAVGSVFSRLRWIQQGHLALYVLYIAVTLLVLLVWNLR